MVIYDNNLNARKKFVFLSIIFSFLLRNYQKYFHDWQDQKLQASALQFKLFMSYAIYFLETLHHKG